MPDLLHAAASRTRARSAMRSLILLQVFAFVCFPGVALGDIYKWIDAKGKTVFSDVPPSNSDAAQSVEMVVKESRLSSYAPAPMATPTEQDLRSRIEDLELQLQARQNPAPAAVYTLPGPYGNAYPSAPPDPPPIYAYPGYARSYVYPVRRPAVVVYPAVTTYISRPVVVAQQLAAPRAVVPQHGSEPRRVEHRSAEYHRPGARHERR